MKKMVGLSLALLGGLALMTGCSAVDPMTVKQTVRDFQEVKTVTAPVPTERYKIAIISRVTPHLSDKRYDEHLKSQMESAVANNFTNLGWFDTVDRKNGVALAGEAMLSGEKDAFNAQKLGAAQLALVSDSSVVYIAKQGWKRTAYADKARGAQVESDFRLIDLETREPLLVKKFRSSISSGKGDIRAAITTAANVNAKKFARVVASRMLPEGKVMQTRGDGQYALVNFGKNYQATPESDTMGAAKVEFFTNEETTGPDGEKRLEPIVVGSGEVIRAEGQKAWVEVTNYKDAPVFKGHCARVSESVGEGEGDDLE